ncbi:hypothetical protein E1258_03055 [Micromonospora sp. KC207]|uniref:hypothetical protein n=1 Tax=Micromonospora sp. KC207 TaxID=2530377 RepID=UPI00105260D8|nr:hypothetical protein [Micromonospora sp. KC207]TDC66331.1 hypothetical protein E1258_03055 [Micromonospora sp. KC207]
MAPVSCMVYRYSLAVPSNQSPVSSSRSRLVAARADQLRDKDVSLSRQLALVAHRIAPPPGPGRA